MKYRDVVFPEIMIENNPHFVENQKDQAAARFQDLGIATDDWDEIREKLGIVIEKIIKKVSTDQEFLSITPGELERHFQGDVPAGQYDAATIIAELVVALPAPKKMPFFLENKGEGEKLEYMARMIVRKRENLKTKKMSMKAKAREEESAHSAHTMAGGDDFQTGAPTAGMQEGAWDKPQHAVIMEAPKRRKIKIKIKKR